MFITYRSFWFIAFLLSLIGCSYLIIKTYNKWQKNPLIVSIDERSAPVWTIPFPGKNNYIL